MLWSQLLNNDKSQTNTSSENFRRSNSWQERSQLYQPERQVITLLTLSTWFLQTMWDPSNLATISMLAFVFRENCSPWLPQRRPFPSVMSLDRTRTVPKLCHVQFQYGQPCCLTRSRHGAHVFKEAYPGLEDVASLGICVWFCSFSFLESVFLLP